MNEITQVPELLDLLDIKGGIVTADAMNCQKEIAAKIKEKKADYVLALNGNQPAMEKEVKAYFDDRKPGGKEKSGQLEKPGGEGTRTHCCFPVK